MSLAHYIDNQSLSYLATAGRGSHVKGNGKLFSVNNMCTYSGTRHESVFLTITSYMSNIAIAM